MQTSLLETAPQCIFKNANACSSHCILLSVEPGLKNVVVVFLLLLITHSFLFFFFSSPRLTSPYLTPLQSLGRETDSGERE